MTRTPPGRLLRWAGAAVVAASGLLAGCASTYRMDNTVQSYSNLTSVPAQAGYRFERLPSQLRDPSQPRLEAVAAASLARVGLQRDEAHPIYSVQVWSRMQQAVSPWGYPRSGGWGIVGIGSHPGVGLGLGFPLGGIETPWYQREVGLIVRALPGGQVVYETHAFNDGYWIHPDTALAAMMDAALQGFPQPPQGVRRVDTPIAR